jgi:myosin-5
LHRWLQAMYATHAKHACFVKPRVAKAAFGLKHFAGEVEYAVHGCLVKNQNCLPADCAALMRTATLPLVARLFHEVRVPVASAVAEGNER